MLFNPLCFRGVRVPGLAGLAQLLPRKLQEVPGVMHGGLGWQGIIPSRAAKMGSIAVDKGIAKLGGPGDFYGRLDPELIAEHILATSEPAFAGRLTGHEASVADQSLRDRFVQILIDRIRAEPYPSLAQMDLLEATVTSPDQLVEYLDALMDKVESTRFPSLTMMRRIQRIAARLPA